jgi:hypothetical protein
VAGFALLGRAFAHPTEKFTPSGLHRRRRRRRMLRDCRSARMRDDARAPNSPRDSAIGVVMPRAMNPDIVSKSKVRQTM